MSTEIAFHDLTHALQDVPTSSRNPVSMLRPGATVVAGDLYAPSVEQNTTAVVLCSDVKESLMWSRIISNRLCGTIQRYEWIRTEGQQCINGNRRVDGNGSGEWGSYEFQRLLAVHPTYQGTWKVDCTMV